ncbi:hypothetical protein [Corynebacterium minutissimum]|uniref:Phage protein n=1 Tax=Corynebacterium minutissimum TaxID=38301 RepID=A0A376CWK8_9CORY|nr:hypothetical protein [Corynebacterium minutissimum]QRP60593.1 hypothetical protein I6J26_10610 [Corynebacterium minutissimum]STC76453.1 Uncharacterised protein [Corynebacterium minutissimum]
MTARKTTSNKVEVAENTDEKTTTAQEATTVETIEFPVTLANGNKVTLEAIKNTEDMDFDLLEHAQRGNYAVFLAGALTAKSRFLLKNAGAKVRDYETVSTAYGEAMGAVDNTIDHED